MEIKIYNNYNVPTKKLWIAGLQSIDGIILHYHIGTKKCWEHSLWNWNWNKLQHACIESNTRMTAPSKPHCLCPWSLIAQTFLKPHLGFMNFLKNGKCLLSKPDNWHYIMFITCCIKCYLHHIFWANKITNFGDKWKLTDNSCSPRTLHIYVVVSSIEIL